MCIDLITLDPATSFVGLDEEGWVPNEEKFDIKDIQNTIIRAGYPMKISPPKASWFQALCEKRVDMIKQALYFQPRRALHVVELELILKRFILDLNNKPVLLKQSQDNFISISRMDLLGKFYCASEGGMFRTGKAILRDIEEIDECTLEARTIFNEIYTEKLREYSRWKYEGETPKVGDIVGVPDKEVHGEPRLGRIVEKTSPHEVVIEMARPRKGHPYPEGEVTTRRVPFRRSPHSLYLVERPTEPQGIFDTRSIEAGVDLQAGVDPQAHNTEAPGLPTIDEEEEDLVEAGEKVRAQGGKELELPQIEEEASWHVRPTTKPGSEVKRGEIPLGVDLQAPIMEAPGLPTINEDEEHLVEDRAKDGAQGGKETEVPQVEEEPSWHVRPMAKWGSKEEGRDPALHENEDPGRKGTRVKEVQVVKVEEKLGRGMRVKFPRTYY